MTSSKSPSTDNLNNPEDNPGEPDDGPILEKLDEKRCGICHEVIMNACRVSCGHHFCRYCLDRKRTSDASKPGENGTPKCTVCTAAINEVQNLSELDKEIDHLYSNLPMKARLDRASLKAQRGRQIDAWKRRPAVVQPSPSATKPPASAQPTTSPFPRRRDSESLLVTPRRNRGVYPERQRSYADIYRESLNLPLRRRSSPRVSLLFQDAADNSSSSEETLQQSRYDLDPSDLNWNATTAPRRRNSTRDIINNSSLLQESPVDTSSTNLTSEYFNPYQPFVIHETYTLRRTRVVDTARSSHDSFSLSPESDYTAENNYTTTDNTNFRVNPEYQLDDTQPTVTSQTYQPRPSDRFWSSFCGDVSMNQSYHPAYHSSYQNNPTAMAQNPHQSLPPQNHWQSDDSQSQYQTPSYSLQQHRNLHHQPGYYSFLPPVLVTSVAAAATPTCPHWRPHHPTDSPPGCTCPVCTHRLNNPPDVYYEEDPSSSYYETSGRTSSEELHSSAGSSGYGYAGDPNYCDYEQDNNDYTNNNGSYDSSMYHLVNDNTPNEFNQYNQHNMNQVDMNLNFNIGFSNAMSGDQLLEDSNYMGSRTGGYYHQQQEESDRDQQYENQNVVDSFYLSNAAATAAAAEGGRGAAAGRPVRRRRRENGLASPSSQTYQSRRSIGVGNLSELPREENENRILFARRRESGVEVDGSLPRMEPSRLRDNFDFDEFGPEISVTEAIIGFRR